MKVGIIVPCRYDSKRLPGKILKRISGKEVLLYLYERLSRATSADEIVVAISRERDDDVIADFCERRKIAYFRGPKNDVAGRLLKCAVKYGFDYFVRICGDNVLADYRLIDEMIRLAVKGSYNLVSNLKDRTFPTGISVEVLKTEFFKKITLCFKKPEQKEHVTSYLYDHEAKIGTHHYFYNNICPESRSLKFALDDISDFDFISRLIGKMKKDHTEYLLKDIYALSKEIFAPQNAMK